MIRLIKKKKSVVMLLTAMLATAAFSTPQTQAKVDKHRYEFTIKANQENSRSAGQYRNTTNPNSKWIVNMSRSNETGSRTKTTFWLERNDKGNVSPAIDVLEDNGYYHSSAYTSANKTTVYLTAENNNYNNEIYTAAGHWAPYGY